VNVAVIGAGYVGLTTAAGLAHLGHQVTCADVDADRVARLQQCDVPILEDGLPNLVMEGVVSGRLQFVVGAENAVTDAEFVFLCVPTPQGEDGSADLSYVEAVLRVIAPVLAPDTTVVTKSTVPVGTTRLVQRVLAESGARHASVTVASNPEFLREGQAVRDFLNPDRIVVGCDEPDAAARVGDLYRTLEAPLLLMDPASAELTKYASNAFLATKISFINAIANLCEAVDADVRQVALGMGYDQRIGFQFLHPGPGYGGSCFPKDVAALVHRASEAGYRFDLLEGVADLNAAQHERMVDKIRIAAGRPLKNAVIAVWGLTFKAGTDDMRDSPAVAIAHRLAQEGATVRAYDPTVDANAVHRLPGIKICSDVYDAAAGADTVAVLTEWDEFRWLDFERVAAVMRAPIVVDTRNLLDPAAMCQRGFVYEGVGRRSSCPRWCGGHGLAHRVAGAP
jgi:UDPglucose 6-dehydrogenase